MPSFPYYTGGFGSNAIDGLYAPGNSGITTNYKADDGTDLGAVCKASMDPIHSSDRRGPVPYYVNGTATSDLFRDVGFQPVSIAIPNPFSYNNNGMVPGNQGPDITPNLFGTNYASNNYSILWTYVGNDGNPLVEAIPNSSTSVTTFFQLFGFNNSDSGITTQVQCTITDNYTGESASDYAYITWNNL